MQKRRNAGAHLNRISTRDVYVSKEELTSALKLDWLLQRAWVTIANSLHSYRKELEWLLQRAEAAAMQTCLGMLAGRGSASSTTSAQGAALQ